MYNKKRVLNELYEIKVLRTISLKTIYHFKNLLNNYNFETKNEIKKQLQLFVEYENIGSLFLEDTHTIKGKEYLIKRLLTKDKNNFRRNKNIVLSDLVLAVFLKYYKDLRFLFYGFVCVSNGFWEHYEPLYLMVFYNEKDDFYHKIYYFHLNGKDYQFDIKKEELIRNEKFSKYDNELYIREFIKL